MDKKEEQILIRKFKQVDKRLNDLEEVLDQLCDITLNISKLQQNLIEFLRPS